MQPDPDPQLIKNRCRYLVYGITLGMAVILALLAIVFQNQALPPAVSAQAGVLTQTVVPTRNITPVESTSTSTPLPAVPPTPNEQTPSALGVTSGELRGLSVNIWHPWTRTEGLALQALLDEFNRTNRWGITVNSIEIRDIAIPEHLKDALSKQAQAERERQARGILGTAEMEIAEKFAMASKGYQENPVALQLRAMNIVYEGIRAGGSLMLIPSSVLDTMNLGGLAALGQVQHASSVQKIAGEKPK